METETSADMGQLVRGETFVVNPTQELLTVISDLELNADENERVNVLLSESEFNSADRNLLVSSKLNEMKKAGRIEFRELTKAVQSNLCVSEDTVGVGITSLSSEFIINVDVGDAEMNAVEYISELWENGDEFEFITPERSFIRDRIIELESEEFYEAFIDALEVIERNTVSIPERSRYSDRWHIYASLVIAGSITETTVKSIGRVAELAELGSRSTISRIKNEIEEHGYIETTTTDTKRGRPPMLVSQSGLYKSKPVGEFTETVFDTIKLKELSPEESTEENGENSSSGDSTQRTEGEDKNEGSEAAGAEEEIDGE